VGIKRVSGQNSLPQLHLSHASGTTAEIYLHGAHITGWRSAAGDELLFLSRASLFASGTPIRGGIPVVFPQFADTGPLPKHGFARTREWEWLQSESVDGEVIRAVLRLEDSAATRAIWPHAFRLSLSVELSEHSLAAELNVTNPGAREISFTAALHTYLRVADVRESVILGLEGVEYRDKLEEERRTQRKPRLEIGDEVDRVYRNAPAELRVQDDGSAGRTIAVHSRGFSDAVVWNPWIEGARSLPDMADEEYLEMVCVEAARVETPVTVRPTESWRGSQRLELLSR
jgi:glucose-6-phosphate 1-epimerase